MQADARSGEDGDGDLPFGYMDYLLSRFDTVWETPVEGNVENMYQQH